MVAFAAALRRNHKATSNRGSHPSTPSAVPKKNNVPNRQQQHLPYSDAAIDCNKSVLSRNTYDGDDEDEVFASYESFRDHLGETNPRRKQPISQTNMIDDESTIGGGVGTTPIDRLTQVAQRLQEQQEAQQSSMTPTKNGILKKKKERHYQGLEYEDSSGPDLTPQKNKGNQGMKQRNRLLHHQQAQRQQVYSDYPQYHHKETPALKKVIDTDDISLGSAEATATYRNKYKNILPMVFTSTNIGTRTSTSIMESFSGEAKSTNTGEDGAATHSTATLGEQQHQPRQGTQPSSPSEYIKAKFIELLFPDSQNSTTMCNMIELDQQDKERFLQILSMGEQHAKTASDGNVSSETKHDDDDDTLFLNGGGCNMTTAMTNGVAMTNTLLDTLCQCTTMTEGDKQSDEDGEEKKNESDGDDIKAMFSQVHDAFMASGTPKLTYALLDRFGVIESIESIRPDMLFQGVQPETAGDTVDEGVDDPGTSGPGKQAVNIDGKFVRSGSSSNATDSKRRGCEI